MYALLLDTVGIQQYIFASNKFKESLGASFLVKDIYENFLQDALWKSLQVKDYNWKSWEENPDDITWDQDNKFAMGYCGGGNALLFFRSETDAKSFVRVWTTELLLKAPSLQTAVAITEFDPEQYVSSFTRLQDLLEVNKNSFHARTTFPGHGITAKCSRSGFSADTWNKNVQGYVSHVANCKIDAEKEAQNSLAENLREVCDKYSQTLNKKNFFPEDLEQLGQNKGEDNKISIVHIDGNGLGNTFKKVKDLGQARRLSAAVRDVFWKSFCDLVGDILETKDRLQKKFDIPDGRIPLMPFIHGGDDITFVCDGRLGMYFAEKYIDFLHTNAKDSRLNDIFQDLGLDKNTSLTACAGVAITKSKYPFVRGYQLAEEICSNAKQKHRKEGGSWIDFQLTYGGFSNSLEEIRNSEYHQEMGSLVMRPYLVTDDEDNEHSLQYIKDKATEMSKIPRSHRGELRKVLYMSESVQQNFIAQQQFRNRSLPEYRDFKERLFLNKETPYLDMMELIEIYPDFEIKDKGEKS